MNAGPSTEPGLFFSRFLIKEWAIKKYINKWTNEDFSKVIDGNPEVEDVVIAGEGNMNYTLRLRLSNGKSLIAKQSPPFCSKFPTIPAPEERIFSEFQFFEIVNKSIQLKKYSPQIFQIVKEENLVFMEDLGSATDFEFLFERVPNKDITDNTLKELSLYLKNLHNLEVKKSSQFKNLNMRNLNHAYIFKLPFEAQNDAIDLDTITVGLQAEALKYKEDHAIKNAALELGKVYYQDTNTLIQGDFYPRSWVTTSKGLFVIDSEFSFFGVPEFDLSVFLAHMLMCGKFSRTLKSLKEEYGDFDEELAAKLIAVEVFRRVMFVSQLPLIDSLIFKKELLAMSKNALLSGELSQFRDI